MSAAAESRSRSMYEAEARLLLDLVGTVGVPVDEPRVVVVGGGATEEE